MHCVTGFLWISFSLFAGFGGQRTCVRICLIAIDDGDSSSSMINYCKKTMRSRILQVIYWTFRSFGTIIVGLLLLLMLWGPVRDLIYITLVPWCSQGVNGEHPSSSTMQFAPSVLFERTHSTLIEPNWVRYFWSCSADKCRAGDEKDYIGVDLWWELTGVFFLPNRLIRNAETYFFSIKIPIFKTLKNFLCYKV